MSIITTEGSSFIRIISKTCQWNSWCSNIKKQFHQ